jgi:hypothetical protein
LEFGKGYFVNLQNPTVKEYSNSNSFLGQAQLPAAAHSLKRSARDTMCGCRRTCTTGRLAGHVPQVGVGRM